MERKSFVSLLWEFMAPSPGLSHTLSYIPIPYPKANLIPWKKFFPPIKVRWGLRQSHVCWAWAEGSVSGLHFFVFKQFLTGCLSSGREKRQERVSKHSEGDTKRDGEAWQPIKEK